MKRIGHVFEQVTAFASLHDAAYRALRANRENSDALRFMHDLEPEILQLQRELESGIYRPGPYHTFTIWEPKERHIAAAPFRDRVVHHSVCAVLEPVFERRYVYDSYACRRDKGSHRAIARAVGFARGNRYFLKCDVRKYFESIDHGVLKGILARLFKDRRFLELLGLIVEHNAPGKGVPIGNLTSQHFANLYLDQLDHFVKEELRVKRYVRYMDDFLCFADSKDELHAVHGEVRAFLREQLHLDLKENKCYVAPVTQGIPFLGMRVFPGTVRLSRPSLVRCGRKLKRREQAFAEGRSTEEKLVQSAGSLIAHIAHANTMTLRRPWFAANEG
ncbi:MAG TPA: reverse transcriptase/maturase family protein [Candidatus Hydrogenedentes bacterium]|nr:reverse transcriptase/maturase family protein [Candidatus Hydrogenedentota bacterium]HPG68433.1 reverse transcriptase/maturase family protein [Candidatus Hydrogenedentota bacterium]